MTGLVTAVVFLLAVNMFFAVTVIFLRARNNLRARRFREIEAVWDPVLIGVVSGNGRDVPPIPDHDAKHVLEISGRFARRLRGPDLERVQAFAAPIVGLLDDDLAARSPETRAAAVELLGVLALDSHVTSIAAALDDPSSRVSLVAARALLHPESSEYMSSVLRHLHRYAEWSPSLMSSMLAQAGQAVLPELRHFLGDPAQPAQARAVVAGALQILRDPQSATIATYALWSHDPELVVACLRLIETVGSSPQADPVRSLVTHPAFFVRSEAATVLGRIGDSSDIETILLMTESDSPWVAIRSARALLDLGQRDILETLSAGHGLGAQSAREALDEAGLR